MAKILYPEESPNVRRRSSIDQFKGFLAAYKQGGWAPVIFDQLDGITCETIKTHPVAICFDPEDVGYIFPEAHCAYASDKFVYFDKNGVEQKILPPCFGGAGEFYDEYVRKNAFVNFDNGTALGTHNEVRLRTGLSVVLANKTLPSVE